MVNAPPRWCPLMITLRAHWLVWTLIVLVVFMAITAPATLGAVAAAIDHLFVTVAAGITHFLAAATKNT